MKATTLFIILIAALIFTSASADDINNPIDIYLHPYRMINARDTRNDSVYAGSLEFTQLPQYEKTTDVIIKHVCWFDTEKGFVFLCSNHFETGYIMDDYWIEFPGEYHKGDTISAIFRITPNRIGYMDLGFSVFEIPDNLSANYTSMRPRIGETISAGLRLGIDGKTAAIKSFKCDSRFVSPFGVSRELLIDSMVFFKDPKPIVHKYSAPINEELKGLANSYIFSVKVVARPSLDSKNELGIDCYVSPYHNLEKGIGFMIMHPDGVDVSDCAPSVVGPVDSSQVYKFSAKLNFKESGTNQISFGLLIMNPDFRKEGGVFSGRKKSYIIGNGIRLYVGIDDNNSIFFISSKNPYVYLSRPEKFLEPLSVIDSRFQIIENLPLLPDNEKTKGSGFDQLITEP